MKNRNALVAERLRMLRAKSNLSQQSVATPCAVSQTLVGKWERGETLPDAVQVAVLCELLSVSSEYLVGRSDFPQGLAPDTWIVDLDALEDENAEEDAYCAKIPRRYRIVDYDELKRLESEGGIGGNP